jgi:hypothetical protein
VVRDEFGTFENTVFIAGWHVIPEWQVATRHFVYLQLQLHSNASSMRRPKHNATGQWRPSFYISVQHVKFFYPLSVSQYMYNFRITIQFLHYDVFRPLFLDIIR